MEILATPANDAAMSRKRTKRITGARELTANKYVGMLQEEKRKKDEAEGKRTEKSGEGVGQSCKGVCTREREGMGKRQAATQPSS